MTIEGTDQDVPRLYKTQISDLGGQVSYSVQRGLLYESVACTMVT